MGATDQDAALAALRATSVPIHDIGTAIYLSGDVMALAAEWGWSNPFAFYFAGRGGMLGEVGPDVVTSAIKWRPSASRAGERACRPRRTNAKPQKAFTAVATALTPKPAQGASGILG